MRTCSADDTVTSLFDNGLSLGIACVRCRGRALYGPRQIVGFEERYRDVRRLPFVCGQCGNAKFDWFVLDREDDAHAFLA